MPFLRVALLFMMVVTFTPKGGAQPLPPAELPKAPDTLPGLIPSTLGNSKVQPVEPVPPALDSRSKPVELKPLDSTKSLQPGTPLPTPVPPIKHADNQAPEGSVSSGVVPISQATKPVQLQVSKKLPQSIKLGEPFDIEVVVRNLGETDAAEVELKGHWTDSFSVLESTAAYKTEAGTTVWSLGTVVGGAERRVRFKLHQTVQKPITEFRCEFAARHQPATNIVVVKAATRKPELRMVVDYPKALNIGQQLSATIELENIGTMPIEKIQVLTSLSEGLRHPEGRNLQSLTARLEPGAKKLFKLNVGCAEAGEATMIVKALAQEVEPIIQLAKITIVDPQLSLKLHGPETTFLNWPGTYHATIQNLGKHSVSNLSLEVKLPEGFSDLRASHRPGLDEKSNRLVWNIAKLEPGQKEVILWFGYAKKPSDLITTSTLSIGGLPMKREEWTTRMAGPEPK